MQKKFSEDGRWRRKPALNSRTGKSGRNRKRDFPESEIGRFVRERRRARGLTQAQLAALVGVGIRALNELERGKPTLQMNVVNRVLAAFAKRLGVVDAPREDEAE